MFITNFVFKSNSKWVYKPIKQNFLSSVIYLEMLSFSSLHGIYCARFVHSTFGLSSI